MDSTVFLMGEHIGTERTDVFYLITVDTVS